MAWKCVKCNAVMEEVDDIKLAFKGIALPEAEGIRCPECGKQYLLCDYVIDELNPAEEMMAGK